MVTSGKTEQIWLVGKIYWLKIMHKRYQYVKCNYTTTFGELSTTVEGFW